MREVRISAAADGVFIDQQCDGCRFRNFIHFIHPECDGAPPELDRVHGAGLETLNLEEALAEKSSSLVIEGSCSSGAKNFAGLFEQSRLKNSTTCEDIQIIDHLYVVRFRRQYKTAAAVGLLLHKTDSDLHKLPAPAHFSRRYA